MARKPVLEGGKRDEIIAAAAKLFFTDGFEKTSVRRILDEVGGEVGMFYHYFRSKDELFDVVADRFFRQYESAFARMTGEISSVEEFADRFLDMFETSMEQYMRIQGNMHWTVRSALHERTVAALIPAAEEMLQKHGYHGKYPLDIAAAKTIAGISAAIHSQSYAAMSRAEKKELILSLIRETIDMQP